MFRSEVSAGGTCWACTSFSLLFSTFAGVSSVILSWLSSPLSCCTKLEKALPKLMTSEPCLSYSIISYLGSFWKAPVKHTNQGQNSLSASAASKSTEFRLQRASRLKHPTKYK